MCLRLISSTLGRAGDRVMMMMMMMYRDLATGNSVACVCIDMRLQLQCDQGDANVRTIGATLERNSLDTKMDAL